VFHPSGLDSTDIKIKNRYNTTVVLHETWSRQQLIQIERLRSKIKPFSKATAFKIIMDISEELESLYESEPNFHRSSVASYPCFADLTYFEHQKKHWDSIMDAGTTEISTDIVVQTNLMSNINIKVKGHIKKAIFIEDEILNYGKNLVGKPTSLNVTLINPTEQFITMRLFIADKEFMDRKGLGEKAEKILRRRFKDIEDKIC
jgi:hypothetical protein